MCALKSSNTLMGPSVWIRMTLETAFLFMLPIIITREPVNSGLATMRSSRRSSSKNLSEMISPTRQIYRLICRRLFGLM